MREALPHACARSRVDALQQCSHCFQDPNHDDLRQKSAGWKGEFSYNKRCNVCTVIFVACKRFACRCQDNNNRQAYLVVKVELKPSAYVRTYR